MTLTQLRYLVAIADSGLNITLAAERVHATQPGLSKQLKQLEDELGFQLFVRKGRSLEGVAPAGERVIEHARRILAEAANIRSYAANERGEHVGRLLLATTHTQARYVLPPSVARLRDAYPKVNISLHQATPDQVARMVIDEVADIGMATESLADYPELVTLPCYEWQHVLVLPPGHPLAQNERIGLDDIAHEPLITYHPSFTGRAKIDAAFAARRLQPRIALEAIDSDVIKTYVRLGLGVGIVAEMAVKGDLAGDLLVRPVGHLFGQSVARVAFKRGAYLRNFVYRFAELLSDRLTRDLVARAMTGQVNDYEL